MSASNEPRSGDGTGPGIGDYVDAVADHWGIWGAVLLSIAVGLYGLQTPRTPPGYAAILLPFAAALALYGYHAMEPTGDVRLA